MTARLESIQDPISECGIVIRTIDSGFVREDFAAAYLIETSEGVAFVDASTARATPRLLEALRAAGHAPSDVRYVIATHAHLDHAGGSGALMQACARATFLAHPRALKHLVQPERLEASARKVYGDAIFDKLYGGIPAVPFERARAVEDGEELSFGEARFRFLHTRGHANHHVCVEERASGSIFTGDTFGLRYPGIGASQLFLFPSTSPTDFDAEAAIESAWRIARSGARRALLTHYGAVEGLEEGARLLEVQLRFSGALYEETLAALKSGGDPRAIEAALLPRLKADARQRLATAGVTAPERQDHAIEEILSMDLRLNAAGLVAAAQKSLHQQQAG